MMLWGVAVLDQPRGSEGVTAWLVGEATTMLRRDGRRVRHLTRTHPPNTTILRIVKADSHLSSRTLPWLTYQGLPGH
jgi:hypothetical protein